MDDQLQLEHFAPRVGEDFTVILNGDTYCTLGLRKAAALPSHPHPAKQREPFSLIFAGPADRPLTQTTCVVENALLGQLAIFIVPIEQGGGELLYQAVFT